MLKASGRLSDQAGGSLGNRSTHPGSSSLVTLDHDDSSCQTGTWRNQSRQKTQTARRGLMHEEDLKNVSV